MRLPGTVPAVALVLTVAAGCAPEGPGSNADRTEANADTALLPPGMVFRHGPATPEAIAGPVYPPVVAGRAGQLSIYEGYFVRLPCSTPLSAQASRGDTITVRLWSVPDSAAPAPCQDEQKPIGYSMLVGQFEPGTYAVRLIHEGDGARPTPLDTVYENITIDAK